MIVDKDTDYVYFSDLLRTTSEYQTCCNQIIRILEKHHIKYDFLFDTKDIWARDYMPIQTDVDRFVQFRYEPSYLKDDLDLQSNPIQVCKTNKINPIPSTINLDGGNVVKWYDKVMITDRVFSENPEYVDQKELIKEIEKNLGLECIIIPQINDDMTGHSDGLVKFIDDKTILGSDLKFEYKYWSTAMGKIIKQYGFEYINMPSFEHKYKGYKESAIGCYMNYLEIGDLIIFPIFEVPGNKDYQAVDLITSIFPQKRIETVNINDIVRHGGLMNCISWNIKK